MEEYTDCKEFNAFVAYFDIYGFKYMEFNNSLMLKIRNSHEYTKTVVLEESTEIKVRVYNFSDSTFLVYELFNNDPIQTFGAIKNDIERILTFYIEQGLPIRGSLSYGNVLCDNEIAIGKPVVRSVSNEQLPAVPLFWVPYDELDSISKKTFMRYVDDHNLSKHIIQTKTPNYKRLGMVILPRPIDSFVGIVSDNRRKYMLEGPSAPAIAWDTAYQYLKDLEYIRSK